MTERKTITVADFLKRYGIDELPGQPYMRRRGEDKLVVRRHTISGGMGSTPTFDVVGVYDGFDWDAGTVFLELDHPVQAADEEFKRERAKNHEMAETIGWIYIALTQRGATPEQKIRNIVNTLRARTGIKLKDVIPGEMPEVEESVGKMVDAESAKKVK